MRESSFWHAGVRREGHLAASAWSQRLVLATAGDVLPTSVDLGDRVADVMGAMLPLSITAHMVHDDLGAGSERTFRAQDPRMLQDGRGVLRDAPRGILVRPCR